MAGVERVEIPEPTKVAEKGSTLIIDVQVPHSLVWLAPFEVDDLIRVGGDRDGGYLVPEAVMREADVLISMGLGATGSSRRTPALLNPALRIHVYDHTVSEKLFKRQYIAEMAAFLTSARLGWAKVQRRRQRLRDYRAFFGKKRRTSGSGSTIVWTTNR